MGRGLWTEEKHNNTKCWVGGKGEAKAKAKSSIDVATSTSLGSCYPFSSWCVDVDILLLL